MSFIMLEKWLEAGQSQALKTPLLTDLLVEKQDGVLAERDLLQNSS